MNTIASPNPAASPAPGTATPRVIAVAMSGGVDSSTVAAMLTREGASVIGLTLQLWDQNRLAGKPGVPDAPKTGRCCSLDDVYDARRVAETLGIPYYVVNQQERFEQDVVRPFDNPIKPDSHLRILYGNLAPGGSVAKISGKEGLAFSGKAIVFESEESALAAILGGRVKAGHVIVIRNEGPVGGPGMREMLAPTSAVMGKGLGKTVGLITDGRFSGGSHGFVVGHITPEAAVGGPIGIVRNGDPITIDAVGNTISLDLSAKEIKARQKAWRPKKPKETRGALAKYARLVTSASEGAVTDKTEPK